MNIERSIAKGMKDIDGIKKKRLSFGFDDLPEALPIPKETLSLFHHVENVFHLWVLYPVASQIMNHEEHLR